jgi:hypothetical protein
MLFLLGSNNNNNNSNSQQSANGKIIPLNKRRVFTVCNNMHAQHSQERKSINYFHLRLTPWASFHKLEQTGKINFEASFFTVFTLI